MTKISALPEISSTDDNDYLVADVVPITSTSTSKITKANLFNGDQTITGIKTFTSSPLVPDPTTATQAANKEYVDAQVGGSTFTTVGFSDSDYICDGVADDVQIQAAIDAVNTAGGGTVFLKVGTYNITHPISFLNRANIILTASGLNAVIVQIPQTSLANFGNQFMLTSDSTGVDIIVENIQLYGQYDAYSAPVGGQGGGISLGTRWTVRNCHLKSFNYFPVWLGTGCSDSKVLYNRFEGPSRGNDNIGGGGGTGVEIAYNTWEANANGNMFDNVKGSNFNIHHNVVKSVNGMFIEGLQDVDVHHNIFTGGAGISIQSDAGYSPATITNSRYVKIQNNDLKSAAITIRTQTSATKVCSVGGDIQVTGNTVELPATYGILLHAGSDDVTVVGNNYLFSNNKILNANVNNVASVNTGLGICHPSGINIMQGFNIDVTGNICVDDRATPQQIYGIEIGQTVSPSASTEPNHVTVIGNQISGVVTAKVHLVSPTFTTDYSNITDGVVPVIAPVTLTATSGSNIVPLTIVQSDTVNNPVGESITNSGSGNSLYIDTTNTGAISLKIDSSSQTTNAIQVNSSGTTGDGTFRNAGIFTRSTSITSGNLLLVQASGAQFTGSGSTIVNGAVVFDVDNASASGNTLGVRNLGSGANIRLLTGGTGLALDIGDAKNIAVGTTTGTKIGTTTSQKLGFFNATPVVQQTGDIITALSSLGLVTAGTVTGDAITRIVTSISSPATGGSATKTDYVYLVSGTTTLTLPTAVGNTNLYTVKNSGVSTVTVATTSAQTIDGSSTASLAVANTSLDMISDNTNWRII